MHPVAKGFVLIGVLLILLGVAWELGGRLGLGRLPGDIVIERERFRFYLPLATSLLLSLLLSLGLTALLALFRWFRE